ncbi:MAG: fasciclin domain-containing protein [Bacteroidetes bacterium]|nr:fasciclin domain-containing protein [Bacteroidota bacterium]
MKKYYIVFIISLIIINCKREYGEYYDPPKGQKGEIYLQLAANPALSDFVSAIDRVPGLKEELGSSGLFTVMAPDNDAFKQYFAKHPSYKSVEAIPVDTLAPLIKFHIMKWMLFQDNFLNPGLSHTDYSQFKYETRATVKYTENMTGSARKLSIFYTSKMVQVYTPNYFKYYGITATDYSDVYGAGSVLNDKTKMNVMGASVKEIDIAGGNGVYHIIDKVLEPPMNIAQELDNNPEYGEYNQMLKKSGLSYSYNSAGTIAQGNHGDANNDGLVDSLWIRNYNIDANLDVENPMTADKKNQLSLTAFIPSKLAFTQYLNTKLLKNFDVIDSIPMHTSKLLFQGNITNNLDWPSRIDKGYVTNILGDKLSSVTRGDIISVKMASNGLFYCTNKVIEPKAFTAVSGPSFFSKEYWYFAEMLIRTGLLPSISSDDVKFTIFAPTNIAFNNRSIYWVTTPVSGPAGFYRISPAGVQSGVSTAEMASIIGNHIIVNKELSVGNMEDGFYPTQNNSFIVVENGKIHGSERDTIPEIIEPDVKMGNGYFHGIDKVMINPQKSIFTLIASSNPTTVTPQYLKFKELCGAAGILTKDFGSITAVDANKKFTLFVPSNEAIIAAQVAGILPKTGAVKPNTPLTVAIRARLLSYIKYFFVPEHFSAN